MAVGDAFGQFLGTATESRQPASGVEERVTTMIKTLLVDTIIIDSSSESSDIMDAATRTNTVTTDAKIPAAHNMFLMITNANFITKTGTTDISYIGGVQTNA